jgi:hypothetical protein
MFGMLLFEKEMLLNIIENILLTWKKISEQAIFKKKF